MKKFWLIVKRGLKNRIFKKSFMVSNVILFLIMVLVMNIPSIISATASESADLNILVYNNSSFNIVDDYLADNASLSGYTIDYAKADITKPMLSEDEFFDQENYNGYIIINAADGDIMKASISLYHNFESMTFAAFLTSVLSNVKTYVSGSAVSVNVVTRASSGNQGAAMIVSMIAALPLFMMIIFAIQMLGVDIVDEKSSKAIEIIIASVPAKTHFLGKITSTTLFVVIQLLSVMLLGLLAGLLSMGSLTASLGDATGNIDFNAIMQSIGLGNFNIPLAIVALVLFTIIGTLFYLVIAAFFASLATTQEDYAQVQTPFMIFLMIGFYVAIFVPTIGETAYGFMHICAYIPFFAPMLSVSANVLGVMSVGEVFISLGVLAISTVLLIFLIAPMYKVSILSYDDGKIFGRIKKAYSLSRKQK